MKYNSFKYLFPPRPEHKMAAAELPRYDLTTEYVAMPKYNGSACMVFTNGTELHIYNRHKQHFANMPRNIDFLSLAKSSKWFVYAGEFLNKGQKGETGTKEKDKFVIWDLLVGDGVYLVGKTLEERLELLEQIYPCQRAIVGPDGAIEIYNHLCCTEFQGVYKAPVYTNGFIDLYKELIETELYEGIVLKKLKSRLDFGFQEKNNHDWQIKCRKENKLYNF